MDRRSRELNDLLALLRARGGGGTSWLYDRDGEDFRREVDPPESSRPLAPLSDPEPRPSPTPRLRMGPVARWLFVHGGMSVVFLGGLMAFAIIAFALGYR
jgi:hypothetical protein